MSRIKTQDAHYAMGILETVSDSSLLANVVPRKVFESIDIFFKCINCQKIYWSGKHVKEINFLVDEINKKIMM